MGGMRSVREALASRPERWFLVEHEGHAAEFGCRSADSRDALAMEAAGPDCRVYPLLGYHALDATAADLAEKYGADAWYATGMPGYEEAVAEQERVLLDAASECLAAAGLHARDAAEGGRPCLVVGVAP